jgi:hypothetical protein
LGWQKKIAAGILRHICAVYDNARFRINSPCLRKLSALNNNLYVHFPKQLGKEEGELEAEEDAEK